MELSFGIEVAVVIISLIAAVESTGTMKTDPNADLAVDADRINNALGYWNTKQSVLLEIVPHRTCAQRAEIFSKLNECQRLDDDDYNWTDGDMSIAVMYSFACGVDYFAAWLNQGIEADPYMDTQMIIELLVLLSFEDKSVKDNVLNYESVIDRIWYGIVLPFKEFWTEKVGGDFHNVGMEMMNRYRDSLDTPINPEAAKNDAKALIEEVKEGLDDHRLKLDELLWQRRPEQVKLTLDEFKAQNNGKELIKVIEDDLGGDKRTTYSNLITYHVEGRWNYLATRLKEVMDGHGTNDKNLCRLICYLAEIDLVEVGNAFQQKYGKSLLDRVKDETSGFEKDWLLAFMEPK